MIAFLRGVVISKKNNFLILDAGGVGYKVFVTPEILSNAEKNQTAEFFIHHQISEQAWSLFGFSTQEDLDLFGLLISVSGIGPKTALSVIASAPTQNLKLAIMNGDTDILQAPGVGKKTAERIVLELKNKIDGLDIMDCQATASGAFKARNDEVEALVVLGYSIQEARVVLDSVDASVQDSSERLRLALKNLGRI